VKRLLVGIPLLAALALPAMAQAGPTQTDKTNAAQECRSERGSTSATREAFKTRYGTNANKSNAFGKCVSTRERAEQRQRAAATSNASKDCKTELAQIGEQAFATKYGTGKKGKNAHGKCVSQKAKAKKDAADSADAKAIANRKSAAKTCATERKADQAAFKAKYGTNRNKSNAFGKCVSTTAKKVKS
jgi:hypothetical protein